MLIVDCTDVVHCVERVMIDVDRKFTDRCRPLLIVSNYCWPLLTVTSYCWSQMIDYDRHCTCCWCWTTTPRQTDPNVLHPSWCMYKQVTCCTVLYLHLPVGTDTSNQYFPYCPLRSRVNQLRLQIPRFDGFVTWVDLRIYESIQINNSLL